MQDTLETNIERNVFDSVIVQGILRDNPRSIGYRAKYFWFGHVANHRNIGYRAKVFFIQSWCKIS
jgi:hypothetical protein